MMINFMEKQYKMIKRIMKILLIIFLGIIFLIAWSIATTVTLGKYMSEGMCYLFAICLTIMSLYVGFKNPKGNN
jgi:uncharacterized membrane protein (DUF106 family)